MISAEAQIPAMTSGRLKYEREYSWPRCLRTSSHGSASVEEAITNTKPEKMAVVKASTRPRLRTRWIRFTEAISRLYSTSSPLMPWI